MPSGPCDICQDEPATWLMHNTDTGQVQGLGVDCFVLLGLGMAAQKDPDELDGTLKSLGYAPTKATRDARKAAVMPDVDPERTIAEIVETGPRDDDPESTSEQADESTDPQADLSTREPVELMHNVAAEEQALTNPTGDEPATDTGDDPPPY